MHRHKVNVAALALVQEILKPSVAVVGDGRGSQASTAGIGVHVLSPSIDSIARRHVGLVGALRLVEAQKMRGASSEPLVDVVVPRARVVTPGVPKHGNILAVVLAGSGVTIPVVGPSDFGSGNKVVGETADVNAIVVSETTLIGGSGRRKDGGGSKETLRDHDGRIEEAEMRMRGDRRAVDDESI